MKKHFLSSLLFLLMVVSATKAQTFLPIATTGYSLDGVAENTTAISTTGGALDASDFIIYSQYYGTLFTPSGVGIPNNGLIASGTRTYQLQPYNGFNVMHLLASYKDSLNFVNPQPFNTISLLGFGTQGTATASITVRFTDNSTQVFTPVSMDDWFATVPSVYNGFDRASRTSGTPAYVGSGGNPRMFGYDLAILCANQGKPIKRVIVQNNSASAHICVLAVAGNLPTYSVTANPAVLCAGASATLSAVGLTTYSWQAVGTFLGSNASSVVVTPGSTTSYTLLGDNGGCPAYASTTLTVSGGLPVLSFTGSTPTICLGATATISASGALTYTLSSPAPNGAAFTPSSTAVYTITGTNGCGSNTQTYTVSVSPLAISAITPTLIVCAGAQATLIAGGAATYTWLPGNGLQANYMVSPTANTTYTVLGQTGNCYGSNTLALSTKPVPTISIAAASTGICYGDAVNLSVSGNAVTYTWSPGNQTSTSINVSPTQLTLYSVVGTNSVNCTSTAQQAIFVNPVPVIGLSALNPTVCSGGASTLIASGANSYTWNPSGNTASTVVNPVSSSVYTVAGSYTTGCSSSNTILITVFSPSIAISNSSSICIGAAVTLSAGAAVSYTWNNGLLGQMFVSVSPSLTTVYSLSASILGQTGVKCTATNSVMVTVNPSPNILISSTRSNSTICVGESILLSSSGAGSAGTYSWSNGVSTATTNVSPTTTKTYVVIGTDNNGCANTVQYTVKVNACTGITAYATASENIRVYPNPSNGAVKIKSQTDVELILRNELGQTLRMLKLNETNEHEVLIEGLAAGIYFVSSINKDVLSSQKIVITK